MIVDFEQEQSYLYQVSSQEKLWICDIGKFEKGAKVGFVGYNTEEKHIIKGLMFLEETNDVTTVDVVRSCFKEKIDIGQQKGQSINLYQSGGNTVTFRIDTLTEKDEIGGLSDFRTYKFKDEYQEGFFVEVD